MLWQKLELEISSCTSWVRRTTTFYKSVFFRPEASGLSPDPNLTKPDPKNKNCFLLDYHAN
jgi:hypothetical protein